MCLSLFISGPAMANNIAVANVSLTDQSALFNHVNVKFDLSWDNSWRTLLVPGNWDAAWVFVKYRVSGGDWHHATLDTAASNHTAPSGSEIDPAPDGKGVFIFRSSTGSGSNSWTNAKLRWKYGADGVADDALLEVKVFAIEMVYIPGSDDYWLGDGNGTSESTFAFHHFALDNSATLYTAQIGITADVGGINDDIVMTSSGVALMGNGGISTNTAYPTAWPSVFSFYIMKYEISQEQYVDFLNCLTRSQQINRVETNIAGTGITNRWVMSGSATMQHRNAIRCDAIIPAQPASVTFYCDYDADGTGNEGNDGQNIACNFLIYPDLAAYLDWSGLRPMTELEYEKASRGPNTAIYQEFAWGSTSIYSSNYTMVFAGMATEGISGLPAATGNSMNANTYSNIGGPARCGIFAASSSNHTRVETGATYYGVMEMSGNLFERTVHLGSLAGRTFRGNHGDGVLLANGYGNVDYWPGINGNMIYTISNNAYLGTTGITGYAGIGLRGGTFVFTVLNQRISDRNMAGQVGSTTRDGSYGGRGVRTAP